MVPRPVAATTAVIFDLDGTLVQTRVASWEIFRKVSEEFGLGLTDPDQYFELFRGNLFTSIRGLCRDDAHADQVAAAFLQRLRDEYAPAMVPGMVDVVRQLAERCTLAVMSSNAMHVLRRILTANEIALCFGQVFGGDVAPDKREAIRQFIDGNESGCGRRCAVHYDEAGDSVPLERRSTVLVTDTAGDVRDAVAEGIRVVGVAWGMHRAEELTAAGAEFVAIWPQEVAAHLLAGAPEPSGAGAGAGACRVPASAAECACGYDAEPSDAAVTAAAVSAVGAVRRTRRLRASRSAPANDRTSMPNDGAAASDELRAAVARVCRPA